MIAHLPTQALGAESRSEWRSWVPAHWHVRRLRHVVDLRVSSIDKHTIAGERPVRLCNYVDVYKNGRITARIAFMRATASPEEITRFRLVVGDVLITKDSETWTDIGVPALVEHAAPDLVCGYHLAILRARRGALSGAFLHRAMEACPIAHQLHVAASGVTRYGLSHDAIKSLWLPVPPLDEQDAIVRFLDYLDRRIRRYIGAKRKLIKLLEEQKQVIIHRAVTRGLDPDVRLKPSGVDGLGEVPEHWDVRRAKTVFQCVDVRSRTGAEELLTVSSRDGIVPRAERDVTMFMAASYVGHKLCWPGDLVINSLWAWANGLGFSRHHGIVSTAYGVYRLRERYRDRWQYLDLALRSGAYAWQLQVRSKGIWKSRLQLTDWSFLDMPIVLPPQGDASSICRHVEGKAAGVRAAIEAAEREVELLRELRARLIADVVTGRLDVREAAAGLPDSDGQGHEWTDMEPECEGDGRGEADATPEEAEV